LAFSPRLLRAQEEQLPEPAETSRGPSGAEYLNGIQMRLRRIRPGAFNMGGGDLKSHTVEITRSFYIAQMEVTQQQYEKIMGANPSANVQQVNPVEQVSWFDAAEFCARLSKIEGMKYRLPTEAEWEYCARGGTATTYHFGNSHYALTDYGWFGGNSGTKPAPFEQAALWALNGWEGKPHPVGHKRPNPWELYDVYGNVFEWCGDWYAADYYENSPRNDPKGPRIGEEKVIRGGSWASAPEVCSSVHRHAAFQKLRRPSIGFRVALEIPLEKASGELP